jgi:hypothetical protein
MSKFKWMMAAGILFAMLACQTLAPKTKTFEHPAFSFAIPAGWQTMEELWGYPQQAGEDYYALGVEKIIMVTGAKGKEDGLYSAYFAVASSPLAGGTDLETRFQQTYSSLIPDLREVSQAGFDQGGLTGFEISYQRPWGEPWWQFRDIWLEKDAVVYVLSFHAPPAAFDKYQDDFDLILKSFNFR